MQDILVFKNFNFIFHLTSPQQNSKAKHKKSNSKRVRIGIIPQTSFKFKIVNES